MADMHMISVTLDDELKQQIEDLKKDKYNNSSYSEFYRHALAAGIKAIKNNEEENKEL